MNEADIVALARRFFDAIERADIETVAEIYADDALIYHPTESDNIESKADSLARLRMSTSTYPGRRYEDRDLHAYPGGFVQRHNIVREHRGETLTAPLCCVVEVADGKITRLWEYFDLAQFNAWRRVD